MVASRERICQGPRILNTSSNIAPTSSPAKSASRPITVVLLPENVPGGLQVLNPLDEWVDVEAPSGAFVWNLGDLMQRWTNDRWRSTMHRVVNPARDQAAGNRRVSFAFFHQPNYDAVIECLPNCKGPGNPPKYPPIASSEHRLRRYLAGITAESRDR